MGDTEAASEPPARTHVRARSLLLSLFAGALVGACFGLAIAPPSGARFESRLPWNGTLPALREWPHPARAGEATSLEPRGNAQDLVVTAGSAGQARALTRAFVASRAPGSRELAENLAEVRARWRGALPAGPSPRPTRAAECAALLQARARWSRELAGRLPLPRPSHEVAEARPPAALLAVWDDLDGATRVRDVAALTAALIDAGEREARWFADASAWPGWAPDARAEAWRRWQIACAEATEPLAELAIAGETPFQRRLSQQLEREQLVVLDERSGDPWASFAAPDPRTVRPFVRPLASAWLPPLVLGALAGALLSAFMLYFGAIFRPAMPRVRLLRPDRVEVDPAVQGPSLHIITGSTPVAVTRAALELAASRIALGERVLLVDGSLRLRLHDRLGRDARWGLLECLAADMPMLGLVQYAGHPGLYLLPYGNAERSVGWSSLGRKLDEVVPHFGRIVLALDPQSPTEVGDALRGRAMEGWWAQSSPRAVKAADSATARFGIVFHPFELPAKLEATLEGFAERVLSLRPPGPTPESAPITAHAVRLPAPPPRPVLEPIVLDCDLQVRQRLRFLAWMRRVQAENRRTGLQASS
jgi:hypothetical protein